MDKIFRTLADPTRRQLLDHLYTNNGQTLSELCEPFQMTRQAVTQHLAMLEAAKLVVIGWRGREKLHFLNPLPIHDIFERWAKKYGRRRLEQSAQLLRVIEENDEWPIPKRRKS
ncbi:MAG: helix-turn-helix domain-containing protein [Candidatus Acidiferrum sp.]